MNNTRLTLTIAAAALLAIPSPSVAEDKPENEPGIRPEGIRKPGIRGAFSPEERVKRMTEELNLSEDQQGKLTEIFVKGQTEMKTLREKGRENLTEEDRTKMREFFKSQAEQVGAVLTPEQKKKWEEAMQKRRGSRGPGGERKPGESKPDAAK